jgi:hypothetical protein
VPVHDCTAGYRAYRRAVLEELPVASVRSNGYCAEALLRVTQWALTGGRRRARERHPRSVARAAG